MRDGIRVGQRKRVEKDAALEWLPQAECSVIGEEEHDRE